MGFKLVQVPSRKTDRLASRKPMRATTIMGKVGRRISLRHIPLIVQTAQKGYMPLEPVFLVGFVGNGAAREVRYSDHAEVQACRRAGDKRVESRGAETSLLGSCAGSEVRRD